MSTATCCSYNFQHQSGGSDSILFEGFVDDVWRLPTEYDEDAYANFVVKYGTHYVKRVTMGSKYVEINRITTEDMNRMSASSTNVQRSAEANACFGITGLFQVHAGGGRSSSRSTSNENQNRFHDSIAQTHIVTLGALPPKDSSEFRSWAEAVVNNPQPIGMELGDISYVLS